MRVRHLILFVFFMLATGAQAQTLEVYSPSDGLLNLRDGPGTEFPVIAEMRNGALVEVLDIREDWARVTYRKRQRGWAHRGYLIKPSVPNHGFFPRNECAVQIASRATLKEVHDVLVELPTPETARVFVSHNGWFAITYGTLRPHEIEPVLKDWKRHGEVPEDSFCNYGRKWLREVSLDAIFSGDEFGEPDTLPAAPRPDVPPVFGTAPGCDDPGGESGARQLDC